MKMVKVAQKHNSLILGVCFQEEYNYQELWTVWCCGHHQWTSALQWEISLIRYTKNKQKGLWKNSCTCHYCIKCSLNFYILGVEGWLEATHSSAVWNLIRLCYWTSMVYLSLKRFIKCRKQRALFHIKKLTQIPPDKLIKISLKTILAEMQIWHIYPLLLLLTIQRWNNAPCFCHWMQKHFMKKPQVSAPQY